MGQFWKKLLVVLALLTVVGCAYGKNLRAGDAAFAAGDYEAALTAYEAAARVDPQSAEAKQKVAAATEKVIEGHRSASEEALTQGDVLGAIVEASKAYKRFPEADGTIVLVRDVSNATFARAQKLRDERDFANALMLYEALAKTLPTEESKAAPQAADVRATWSAQLRSKADEAYGAGRKGDALLQYAKVAQLTTEPGDLERKNSIRAEIVNEWAYWVQLQGGRGDAYENVVAGLSGVSPTTSLRVGEKMPPTAQRAAVAKFDLKDPKFRTEQTRQSRTVQYQSGTKLVENPFYKSKQDKVLDEERRLVDYQNEVSRKESDVSRYEEAVAKEGDTPNVSTGAEQSLSNARSQLESARRRVEDQRNQVMRAKEELAREPQTREEPVYSDHTFDVITHIRHAELPIEVRIRHTDDRAEVKAIDAARTQASDDAHPAQPIARVAADPLQLPSDAQLAAQLYSQVVAKSKALIDSSFAQWRTALVERALAAPTDDERVNLMVIYIVTDPSSVTPKVPADLAAMRGIPDSVRLLSP